MTALEWLESTYNDDPYLVRPRAKCADGFSVSIQGGTYFHYCHPREKCNTYIEVELGFPSGIEEEWMPYVEDPDNPKDTVYARVPIEVVESVIAKHGGILERDGKK